MRSSVPGHVRRTAGLGLALFWVGLTSGQAAADGGSPTPSASLIAWSIDALVTSAALPILIFSAYLALLTVASWRPRALAPSPPRLRFDVVIPAHDEAEGIAATVESVLAVDYPPALRRVMVVADNCGDATALRARKAGAFVLCREDTAHRGKGYALARAFEFVLADPFADAVVVVDADTVVSRNLLRAFAAQLAAGAVAVQARYGVRNPGDSWRTNLMAIAFALFHDVRSNARQHLHCSTGLRGNGMCFARRLLGEVPHNAFSIVEDVEYGIRLGLAGYRVHFAGDASVLGDMLSEARPSASQRRRWEQGRALLVHTQALPLLRRAFIARSGVLLDLALDLLVPPLTTLGASAVVGLGVSLLVGGWLDVRLVATWAWAACVAAIAAYVVRGWSVSHTGLRGLASLARVPLYALWKLSLALKERARLPGVWIRTPRERRAWTQPG